MSSFIYKVVSGQQWSEFQASSVFDGAPIDLQDGFIHFSTGSQLGETLSKHFGGQQDLMLLEVAVGPLGESLKWEPSRNQDLFPHLYRSLVRSEIGRTANLSLFGAGQHQLPAWVKTTE